MCAYQPPTFACSALFLISQLLQANPALYSIVTHKEDHDDEEEKFTDANKKKLQEQETNGTDKVSSEEVNHSKQSHDYDPLKREPLHSGASNACAWELVLKCMLDYLD